MGGNVVKKTNPATMTGRAMGYSKDSQKKINKGKIKVSSPHLKMMGQSDIENGKKYRKNKKKKNR